MMHKMADEREQPKVDQKVHLMGYQKDHWVVYLKVPRPSLMMVRMMEQLTEHQMVCRWLMRGNSDWLSRRYI